MLIEEMRVGDLFSVMTRVRGDPWPDDEGPSVALEVDDPVVVVAHVEDGMVSLVRGHLIFWTDAPAEAWLRLVRRA